MNPQTESEKLFQAFCDKYEILCVPIPAVDSSRPDFKVTFGGVHVAVEVKQLETVSGLHEGTHLVGSEVRAAIDSASDQTKWAEQQNMPAIVLIYNAADGLQMLGTETHDFISGMYGEFTKIISKVTGRAGAMFHGREAKLRHDTKTRYSAVGHLIRLTDGTAGVILYENAHASLPLPFDHMPQFITIKRAQIEHVDPTPTHDAKQYIEGRQP